LQPGPLPKTDDDRLRATGRALRYAESSARPPTPRPGTPPHRFKALHEEHG